MAELELPEPFEDLAPYLDWALEPERALTEKKAAASMDEIRAFYDAMISRIDEILDYLEPYFGRDMPAPAYRLYLMSLTLVDLSTLVEFYKRRESIKACDPLRFIPQQ
ncbi:MAG: hypothetical protein OXB94_02925 [Nitrospira sp.]|nr:hypothetical protein [Nitrospira sp.]